MICHFQFSSFVMSVSWSIFSVLLWVCLSLLDHFDQWMMKCLFEYMIRLLKTIFLTTWIFPDYVNVNSWACDRNKKWSLSRCFSAEKREKWKIFCWFHRRKSITKTSTKDQQKEITSCFCHKLNCSHSHFSGKIDVVKKIVFNSLITYPNKHFIIH